MTGAQRPPTTQPAGQTPQQSKAAADIPLDDNERRIILDLGKQIDILVLKQQNAILTAANDHGVSLKSYELVDRNNDGKLVFTPKR